ncbi:radical SAM protein [Candidatus Woesearchaeota archaeon]|nr:radical SAM protein [Candidatus Woesearchaeota archaeon]
MKGVFPESVDFIVTDKCNLHCKVCWGSEMPCYEEPGIIGRKDMIDIFYFDGVEKTVFTGGEPMVEESLPGILKHAKYRNMGTLLFTNCMLMDRKRADRIMPYVDAISISLDDHIEHLNDSARGNGHFRKVMHALDILKKYSSKVQVLTVVTSENRYSLRGIGNLLLEKTEGMDFGWKLNYYTRIGRSAKETHAESDPFYLEYSRFMEAVNDAENHFSGKIRINHSPPNHDYGYLFVFPDGNLYTTKKSEYICLGNVFDSRSWDKGAFRKIDRNIAERNSRWRDAK